MHGITTIHKLNREAAEAARILNARNPAAPAPVADYPTAALKERAAHAQETIARLTKHAA